MELVPYLENTVGLPYNLQNVANIIKMTNRWVEHIRGVKMGKKIRVTTTKLPILMGETTIQSVALNSGEIRYEVILLLVKEKIVKIIL